MATTVKNVKAGIAYRETQRAISQELDALKALLMQHETTATDQGIHWGHVGDLTEVLTMVRRITQPNA